MRVIAMLAIAACAKPAATAEPLDIPPPRPRPDAAPPPPASTTPPVVLASCPATYAEAAASTCGHDQMNAFECKYPDGQCSCRPDRGCTGLPADFDRAPILAAWQCAPTERPDGCPGTEPHAGDPCTPKPGMCAYTPCGGTVYACRKHHWVSDHVVPGPP